jgi:TPR repeat protein
MKKLLVFSVLAFALSAFATPIEEGDAALNQKNYALAISKYGDAAASGSIYALIKLSALSKDYRASKEVFDLAFQKIESRAKTGDTRARLVLADAYLRGYLITRNCTIARNLHKELASEGDTTAQHNLGGMYLSGDCVPKDYALGYMWRSLHLAQSNNENGDQFLASLERNLMSRDQVAQAQKMARECFKNKYKNCD